MNRPAPLLARCLPALADRRTDGELITAFLHDGDEPAFAELLRRHGPLVWSACRRLLPDHADAEDAFQTAFLVLVRQARRLTTQTAVGPWLYRVAVWTARNARRRNARTLARRRPLPAAVADSSPGVESAELRLDLDAALLALPEKYRAALVLCHLQGWSRRDAADRLGCPEGTLSSLLARGLTRLRAKLAGHNPFTLLAGPALAVPAALSSATARAAGAARLSAALFPVTISHLAEGVLRMFWVKKATAATTALVAVFAFGIGVGMNAQYGSRSSADDTATAASGDSAPIAADDGMAQLKAKLEEAKAALEATRVKLQKAKDEYAQVQKTTNDPKALDEHVQRIVRLQREVEDAASRAKLIVAQIEKIKGNAKPTADPAKPPPAKPAVADHYQQLAEAQAQFAQLKVEYDALARQSDLIKERAAAIDARTRYLTEMIRVLESQREKIAPVAKGALLEVTIIDEKAAWPFSVKEFDGKTGKLLGTLTCDTADILGITLSRVMKDPAGPRDLRITVQPNTPYERVRAVLEACKAAGFKEAWVSGTLPAPPVKPGEPKPEAAAPGGSVPPNLSFTYSFNSDKPVPLDELLKSLSPKK